MRPAPHQDFNTNVFINCPFDREYDSLLKPILFTIIYFGFTPQIASRTGDSGEQRITKILSLILKSKYSIHDLSRIKPHDYKKVLSDLAGIDASSHMNNPKKVVGALRNWFVESVPSTTADSATTIWSRFTDFRDDFYARRKRAGFSKADLKTMPVSEYISFIRTWTGNNK